jgi:alkanesulfonate monooxygenase SsuD/methylene tetrahydromethanopterin reductase-like flavin-dependent oxidoreductase (luciferase family)
MGGGTPDMLAQGAAQTREAFQAAGRSDAPRIVALCYFALGPDAEDAARASLGDYYAFLGDIADQIVASAVTDAETARGYRDAFAAAGGDELIYFPCSPDPAQVDLLAEALA